MNNLGGIGLDERPSEEQTRRRWRFRWSRILVLAVVVGLIIPILGFGIGYLQIRADARALKADYHAHKYGLVASDVKKLGGTLGAMHSEAVLLGWTDVLPYVRGYYLNVMDLLTAGHTDLHVLGQALAPVMQAADAPNAHTTAHKEAVAAAVSEAGDTMSRLEPQMALANEAIQRLNANRIPGVLVHKGVDVSAIKSISSTLLAAMPLMTGPHPIIASLLGFPSTSRYLLIFQNSGELRSTGGFMTAYAYVPFKDGRLEKITSQNIETLDQAVTYHPPAPAIIGAYLPVKYWHLRDANTSPDVPQTVKNIYMFYRSIPHAPKVNGVVFIDTWLVDDLIADVGGLNVPTVRGKTVHLTAENANYEMEYMAEGMGLPANLRKLFIGTMMKELMHDVFHSHVTELMKVAATFRSGLDDKNVLLYFNNTRAETYAARLGWGGIVPKHVKGNYVQVVDENLLGHKDNYYVRESYDVTVKTINGRNQETVTIHWVDPAIVNWWLTVPYHSWVRVYAPIGSSFISMTGVDSYVDDNANTTLNKQVFGGHVDLPGRMTKSQPVSKGTVVTKFWLPKRTNIDRIYIQKQPGMLPEPVTVTVNGVTRHITINSNAWLTFGG